LASAQFIWRKAGVDPAEFFLSSVQRIDSTLSRHIALATGAIAMFQVVGDVSTLRWKPPQRSFNMRKQFLCRTKDKGVQAVRH
jgi:hypothetical protein